MYLEVFVEIVGVPVSEIEVDLEGVRSHGLLRFLHVRFRGLADVWLLLVLRGLLCAASWVCMLYIVRK